MDVDDIVVTGQSGVVPEAAVIAAANPDAGEPAVSEPDVDDTVTADNGGDPASAAADAAAGGDDDTNPTTEPDPASEAGKALAKRRSSLQKRIDQFKAGEARAQRERDEAKARADRAEAELAALRAGKPAVTPSEPPAAEKPAAQQTAPSPADDPNDPQPDLADYTGEDGKTYEKWIADQAMWAARQALRDRDAAERARVEREAADRASDERRRSFQTSLEAFKATHPDFDTVLAESDAVVTDLMRHFIETRPEQLGAALTYHLAKNPEESLRIAGLEPLEAAAELGAIVRTLSPAKAATTTGPASKAPVTRAPLPSKPVGIGASASAVPVDDLDTDDYIERRNQEEMAARRRR